MAVITNTYRTYAAKGIREELSEAIYNIAPEDTPFMSNAGRDDVDNTFFEWQTDTLAAAVSNNQVVEGDDVTAFVVPVATVRLGNYCEIARKDALVSGTLDRVMKAGRKSELAYRLAIKSAELKRDMETSVLSNKAKNAGAIATARQTAGILSWIKTNTDFGAGGADPAAADGTGVRTDGTPRAFTETLLKTVLAEVYTSGGNPKMLMVGPGNKQVVSGFAGVATKTFYTDAVKATAIIGAADIYVSDFGTLSVVPNRFQRNRDAFALDMEFWSLSYLRPFTTIPLAKTGDAEKRIVLAEFGLRAKNEAASGLVADLT